MTFLQPKIKTGIFTAILCPRKPSLLAINKKEKQRGKFMERKQQIHQRLSRSG